MSGDDDLGPVPTRFPADVGLVECLVASQFPQWADRPIRRVRNEGWDNRTFHLGDDLIVRLPSAAPYALAVDKEHRWLPVLRPQLPLPIPVPVAMGAPGHGYPHRWSVYRWLNGERATTANIEDPTAVATTLAHFLRRLQQVDPTGGPAPGQHNWYRGGPLTTYDRPTQRALETLDGIVPTDRLYDIWQYALRASWDEQPRWFHGDIAPGNLLVADGALVGVIDFGTCGVGDPACDLAIAWTFLSDDSRDAFAAEVATDPGTWARGRGWALWKTLVGYCDALHADDEPRIADAKHVLDQIMIDYAHPG